MNNYIVRGSKYYATKIRNLKIFYCFGRYITLNDSKFMKIELIKYIFFTFLSRLCQSKILKFISNDFVKRRLV